MKSRFHKSFLHNSACFESISRDRQEMWGSKSCEYMRRLKHTVCYVCHQGSLKTNNISCVGSWELLYLFFREPLTNVHSLPRVTVTGDQIKFTVNFNKIKDFSGFEH